MPTVPRKSKVKRPLWAEAIAIRRFRLGLTQEELAGRTQDVVSQGTISDIERGKVHPLDSLSGKRLGFLIQALEWTPEQFEDETGIHLTGFTSDEEKALPANAVRIGDIVSIRFLGSVSAGLYASGEAADETKYLDVPRMFIAQYKSEDLFALEVTGDSMASSDVQRHIPEGSFVIVHSNLQPSYNGQLVVVWLEHEHLGVLKEWKKDERGLWLLSYNPDQDAHGAIRIDQNTPAQLCGVVIGDYRFRVGLNGKPIN